MSKLHLLKTVIESVDVGGISVTNDIATLIRDSGIEDNIHVGKPKEFFSDDERIVEWYLGQFLNIIVNESWFAMNSLINQSSVWVKQL